MAKYTVVSPTGPHGPGEVVEISDEHVKKGGVDIARLVGLGAIREATDEEAEGEVVPLGTSYLNPLPQPIPLVEPKPEAIKPTGGKRADTAGAPAEQAGSSKSDKG